MNREDIELLAIGMAHSNNGTPILFGMDQIVKFGEAVLEKANTKEAR